MVFALSTILAKDFFPDPEDRMSLVQTSPTHDIGKICVPLEILKKSDPLSRAELSILEHHAAAGYVLLSYYYRDTRNLTVKVARDHHERIDNSGYPRGISLSDKMIEIIAVCDVYDALISSRPYRVISYDNRTALEEITTMAEKGKFSWDVVKALVAHNRKSKPHLSETTVSLEKRGTPPPDNLYGVIKEEEDI
jgi:HD-GYP domain-containing protein (c-di-GMP phosphodiesterase class II)